MTGTEERFRTVAQHPMATDDPCVAPAANETAIRGR